MQSPRPPNHSFYALDLRDPRSLDISSNGALDRFGRIDPLLSIAGAVPQMDLFEMTDPQWDDGTALKLHDARRLTIGAWEALKASKDKLVDAILPTGILPKTNLIQ
jgi:3-oxoacyl-[acyl-carrier protein] reductase